jgi:Na+/melibiose symporter-like transporter
MPGESQDLSIGGKAAYPVGATAAAVPAASQKLSVVEKVGYSLGDCAANFIFQTVMMFLMFFYTDVMGISPVIAGMIFLVTRIFDAVNDPMMGAISDRTNTRWGKFRPWVLGSAVPFGVIGILMFTNPDLSAWGKIIYAFVTYNLMMMIYTVNNVPYCALTGVLTGNNAERTSLTSYRFMLAMIASFVVQSFSIPLVNYLGVDNKSIVQATVQADQLTIAPRKAGLARIIIQASDGKGNVTKKEFFTKVTKPVPESPTVKTALADLVLEKGFGQHDVDLAAVFHPGEYGPVTYAAIVQNEGVVKAKVDGSQLKLTEVGVGVTNIMVTAQDRLKCTANTQFSLAVNTPGNSLPKVKNQLAIDVEKGFGTENTNLNDLFADDDGDSLVYSVKTTNGVISTSIEGSRLTLGEIMAGEDRLVVTASDAKGGEASLVIPVIVRATSNMAPTLVKSLPTETISSDATPTSVKLSDYFKDPDKDNITYSASVINQSKGYQRTMMIFCSLAVIFFVITFITTKERVRPDPKQKTSLKQDVSDLIHNSAWISLFFLTVFIFIYLSLRGAVTLYYFTYYVGRADLFSLFNMLGMGVTLAAILLAKPLSMRFGKRNTFMVCLFLTAVFATAYLFVPPNAIVLIFVLQVLVSGCYAPTIPTLWAMMADVADYTEWKTGRRATGITFSATTFGLKMGLSLGGATAGWLLAYFGYIANQEQTEFALKGIRMMMSIIPAVPFFLGVAMLFMYRINKSTELQMTTELIERRKQFNYD